MPPTLMLGYAQAPAPTIRSGVIEIAEAVRATGAGSLVKTAAGDR
jgi:hypothetical protein